jgi:hypothetical protein
MWHADDGMGWWMLWGGLMMVLFWGAIIALIVWAIQSVIRREPSQTHVPHTAPQLGLLLTSRRSATRVGRSTARSSSRSGETWRRPDRRPPTATRGGQRGPNHRA